jgi:hypothetical protein
VSLSLATCAFVWFWWPGDSRMATRNAFVRTFSSRRDERPRCDRARTPCSYVSNDLFLRKPELAARINHRQMFADDKKADALLTRDYQKGFEIPRRSRSALTGSSRESLGTG